MKSILDPNKIPQLLGKSNGSEEVLFLFKKLDITWEDIQCVDRDIQHYIWTSQTRDIQLDFFEAGFIFNKKSHHMGEDALILDQLVFWGYDSEANVYSGPLVNGIQITDTQEVVLQKMGEPEQRSVEFDTWTWIFNNYKLNFGWTNDNRIGVISYRYVP